MTVAVTVRQIRVECLAQVTAGGIEMNSGILITGLNVFTELGRTAAHSSTVIMSLAAVPTQRCIMTVNRKFIFCNNTHMT